MDAHDGVQDGYSFQEEEEDTLPRGGGGGGGGGGGEDETAPSAAETILGRVSLHLAFGSEKLLNLHMLVMEVATRAADIEPLTREPRSVTADSVVDMAFELDVLYGIVESEVHELEMLAASVETDIAGAESAASEEEETGSMMRDRLQGAMESLEQMQEVISAIRRESSASFHRVMQPLQDNNKPGTAEMAGCENGHTLMSPHAATQAEGQRNVLEMLDQSIAGELDLQMKLCDSRSVVEDLTMRLHQAEQESYFWEESVEAIYERMFAAEHASQLFLGMSEELIVKLTTAEFCLSASVSREADLRSKSGESLMKLNASKSNPEMMPGDRGNNASQEAVQTETLSPREFLTLRDKVQQLEDWLMGSVSQSQLSSLPRGSYEEEQNVTQSEKSTFGKIISDLKVAISNAESRTQNAEARCKQLTQTNAQLSGELNSLKAQGSDRAGLLEKRLEESDTQLEHAKASVDAICEQQGMLKSSMSDMEQTIEDLKEKFFKAETRAENAESKCTLLTDTNLELSEELSFMRGRVESLENSLHQANQLKMSNAKDIGIKTKTITDLVAKLALERERLHLQIVTLTKRNKMLAQKCRDSVSEATPLSKKVTSKEDELRRIEVTEETSAQTKEAEVTPLLEDESGAESKFEAVRSIDPSLVNWKCIFSALLVLLAAVLVYQLYQEDDRVQQLLGQFVGF
ncbi:hypothetical protein ACP4OV_020796 [Aristida adscensionis]